MPPSSQSVSFSTANPHALATILDAGQTRSIIASRDIFDVAGIKLWARDQPVSQTLQRKLLDRQLRHPLESCLIAEDGITGRSLTRALEELLERDTPLAMLLQPCADKLVHAATHLPLHAVAQLLLTAGQVSRPESFEHAVQAMSLAGALMIAHGGNTHNIRLAMLAGLVHDLGEMYIAPEHGEDSAERTLDFQSYQQLVVHSHVGKLLIEQLTNYPPEVARAVAEHHERLDGSGYPHCLHGAQVSPLGRLLGVCEGTLASLRGERPHLARASMALRVVPGEYDLGWAGPIAYGARRQPPLQAALSLDEIQARLARLDAALQTAQLAADALQHLAQAPALKDALNLAQHLLSRLRTGWNASGLWSKDGVAVQDAAEVEAIEDELVWRLQSIKRATLLRAGELAAEDALPLNLLCDGLMADAV